MKKKLFDTREKRAKANIVISLVCQILTLICGFIVPRLLIHTFGSEAYGATSSITQFLAYITLLEGGIAGVTRAALYKPLAERNNEVISSVVSEIKHFFRIIAYIFVGYVLVLACCFKTISHTQYFDWMTTFILVIVISASTFAQYFIGISNAVLLQADQKTYITNIISITATVINTILVVVLVRLGANLVLVKLGSSIIFVLRPIVLGIYVRNNYKIYNNYQKDKTILSQKWTGLGQHIAYFFHSNTDIAILTIFGNLKMVAVYTVYNMVVTNIQSLTTSFSVGMEALFGDMLAKKEYDNLNRSFGYYESLLSVVSTVMFSCTTVLIIPFVRLYTNGINDANYIAPLFSIFLSLASYFTILRIPYHNITIAAGVFKETRLAAYGEAIINIVTSIILVQRFSLIGVAIGTLLAVCFRFLFYVVYLSNHVIKRKIVLFIKRIIVNVVTYFIIILLGEALIEKIFISNYICWIGCGLLMVIISLTITITINLLLYREETLKVLTKIFRQRKR